MFREPSAHFRWPVVLLLAQACGGSAAALDPSLATAETGAPEAAPAPTESSIAAADLVVVDGAACATSSDCVKGQKCSETRQCIASFRCNTDADCEDGGRPFCDSWHQCEPCRGEIGCPADKPVCSPHWEFGVECAECRVGDSSRCAAGSWCSDGGVPATPSCRVADCANDRRGPGCTACINEHAESCFDLLTGGECRAALLELRRCMGKDSGDDGTCPVDRLSAVRGCVPSECQERAQALDTCLYGCQAALLNCTPH